MKKKTIISCFAIVATFLSFTFPVKLYALNYTISFTGTGASTSVESVVVQNLTKGTTVTVPTGNVLNLTDVATFVENINTSTETISVYPNPMQEKSNISFFAKSAGITQINVFSLEGKKIIGVNRNLPQGNSSFQLSMPKGAYTIQIQGNSFSYSAKVISQSNSDYKAKIVFTGNENQITNKLQKSKSAITTMLYTTGDQLLYKGTSGNYTTIVTDKPTGSKTTNFEFFECKDADNNYYSIVKIGTQTWMAENLKTTKFNDGNDIPQITDRLLWNTTNPAYCWYNNDMNTNKNSLGALYNWFAVNTNKLQPNNWHIPTDQEWTILENYLIMNGGNFDGSLESNLIAKSLAGFMNWNQSTITGAIGNNLSTNNSTGFGSNPSGYRFPDGVFNAINYVSFWWSIDMFDINNAVYRRLRYDDFDLYKSNHLKQHGFSIRCIKD